jgi:hypothetical protein
MKLRFSGYNTITSSPTMVKESFPEEKHAMLPEVPEKSMPCASWQEG